MEKRVIAPEDVKVGDKTVSYDDSVGKVLVSPIPADEWEDIVKYDDTGWMDDKKALYRSVDMEKDFLFAVNEGEYNMVYVYGEHGAWVEK